MQERKQKGQSRKDIMRNGEDSESLGLVSGSSVGHSSVVGEGATVTNSVILDYAEVGAGSILDECLIGRGARIPEGTEMKGKIVGHDSHLG